MNNEFFPNATEYPNATNFPNNFPNPLQGTTPDGSQSISPYTSNNPVGSVRYADTIFYLNIGNKVTVYFSYPDSLEWRDKVFTGTIRDAGKDYLLLRDEEGKDILLWIIYINYATFDGNANTTL